MSGPHLSHAVGIMFLRFVIRRDDIMRNRLFVLVLAVVGVVAVPAARRCATISHATVKLLPDAVVVEAGFDGDTPAEEAVVHIATRPAAKSHAARLTRHGVCRLPLLGPGKYVAMVESIGHRDEVAFEVAVQSDSFEFSNWRLDKRLGLAIGLGGLFWRSRPRSGGFGCVSRPLANHCTSDFRPGSG